RGAGGPRRLPGPRARARLAVGGPPQRRGRAARGAGPARRAARRRPRRPPAPRAAAPAAGGLVGEGGGAGMMADVTVIKINAITVPEGSGDELARRFAARAGAVDDQDGFEGFELLRPTDGRNTWLVVTRWRDEEAFQAWV